MPATIYGNQSGTVGLINAATAQNSTSGTSIDFTGIPVGVKRITVMFNGVSTNGTSVVQIQVGAGSVTTSGYVGSGSTIGASTAGSTAYTTGFGQGNGNSASDTVSGHIVLTLVGSNIWACSGTLALTNTAGLKFTGGTITLSGTLDRVRVTTVNGTDTFDAGSINILYE